jgi:hypothetical protein
VARLPGHRALELQPKTRQPRGRLSLEQLPLDRLEREERLAQREGQLRSHLEDGEVVRDERAERLLGLVVRRVGLEHQALLALGERAQRRRGPGLVAVDDVVAELDARLDDLRQHPRPGRLEPPAGKRGAGELEPPPRVLDACRNGPVVLAGLAARRRDLGSDHVDGQRGMGGTLDGGGLRRGGELRGALGDDLVRERSRRIVATAHARVEMNLLVAGAHVLPHHLGGALHRGRLAVRRKGVRPQVIAAEDHAALREPRLGRQSRDERHELVRPDSGVAAVLVHLVRGRLDEHAPAVLKRLLERRLEHERVGRTDRRDAAGHAALLHAHELGQHRVAVRGARAQRSHRSRFSSTKASSVRCG